MDDSLVIVLAFTFCAGLVFTLLGFTLEWPYNVPSYAISAIFWLVLGVVVPMAEATFPLLGWLFIILAILTAVMGAVEGVGALVEVYRTEEWQKEED